MTTKAILKLLIFIAFCAGQVLRANNSGPFDNWEWLNPKPQGNDLFDAAYGNGTYVAVGTLGTVVTSSDGANWTSRHIGTLDPLAAVAFGNDGFVAVAGHRGFLNRMSGSIYTSNDGTNWISRPARTQNHLIGVAYGNNMFVAVGQQGTIISSPDRFNWAVRPLPADTELRAITYGKDLFVAVGYGVILISRDGLNWETRYSSPSGLPQFESVASDGTNFVAVAMNTGFGARGSFVSSNGIDWEEKWLWMQDIAFGNGVFVGPSVSGGGSLEQIGENSVTVHFATPMFSHIAFCNDRFVSLGGYVGWPRIGYEIQTSADGIEC
jgi:hypothetical protein